MKRKITLGLIILVVMLSMFISKGNAQWEQTPDYKPWDPGEPQQYDPMSGFISLLVAVALFGVLPILCIIYIVRRRRAANQEPITIREREIVRERTLVICPYCGTKNEQGISKCQKCGAEM